MLRRIVALIALALLPAGTAVAALNPAPIPTAPTNITGALLDQMAKSTATAQVSRKQGLMGYIMSFHDDKYKYSIPVCDAATLVEVDGRRIEPTSFVINDALVISMKPNAASSPAACIDRVVRQQINRGASGGECLQGFQVKHEIEGAPSPLVIKTQYTYLLTIYARPTLDCDGKAYGSSPITTVVAPNQPFIITLQRDTSGGVKELMRWSLTTDAAGKTSFAYTFAAPSTTYKFQVLPGGNAKPGDVIGWDAKVIDPNPSPSPAPVSSSDGGFRLTTAPFVIILVLVLVGAGIFEAIYWLKKRREHELPEQEYRRTPQL